MKKLCRRKVFIRQKDFHEQLEKQAYACGYTNAYWKPISLQEVEKEIVLLILKDELQSGSEFFISTRELKAYANPFKKWDLGNLEKSARIYISYAKTRKNLYHEKYSHWSWKYDTDTDRIYIRYRVDQPWIPMGIGVLEREYELNK